MYYHLPEAPELPPEEDELQELDAPLLEDVLGRIYFALYLIGRSGNQVDPENTVRCIANMIKLHNIAGNDAINTTFMKLSQGDISGIVDQFRSLSADSPQIPENLRNMAPVYICYALGAAITPTKTLLMDDLLVFPKS